LLVQLEQGWASTEFAVGDVKEIAPAQQPTQALPGFPMSGVVGLIAGIGFEMDGHGAIGTDGEAVDELFEVGTVVFAIAATQLQPLGMLVGVSARELDGR
jgi:hypothetical protein